MALLIPLFTFSILTACSDKSDDTLDTSTTEDTASEIVDGPTIWSGPSITFTKESGADATDRANQDAIPMK